MAAASSYGISIERCTDATRSRTPLRKSSVCLRQSKQMARLPLFMSQCMPVLCCLAIIRHRLTNKARTHTRQALELVRQPLCVQKTKAPNIIGATPMPNCLHNTRAPLASTIDGTTITNRFVSIRLVLLAAVDECAFATCQNNERACASVRLSLPFGVISVTAFHIKAHNEPKLWAIWAYSACILAWNRFQSFPRARSWHTINEQRHWFVKIFVYDMLVRKLIGYICRYNQNDKRASY